MICNDVARAGGRKILLHPLTARINRASRTGPHAETAGYWQRLKSPLAFRSTVGPQTLIAVPLRPEIIRKSLKDLVSALGLEPRTP
jgi:hypothetical protein